MLSTRLDLAFAVSIISRFSSNPTNAYWSIIKRVFRYITSTLDMGLIFRGEL
jgi:hypothetical protein